MMTATNQHLSAFDTGAVASLYDGTIMHQRMSPFRHRFTYRVWSLLADIDRLSELSRLSPLFSHNCFNLVSFHDRDHGAGDGSTLRAHVDRLLREAQMQPARKIFLLCYPRVLGYAFNPISVYYCFGDHGALTAMIYEVRNTFCEKHTYVAPIDIGQSPGRQERRKLFFVSPFLGFGLTYRFRFDAPGERLRLRILEVDDSGPVLAASFHGERLHLTTTNLLRLSWAVPLLGIKVMTSIHWEALKLWIKGAGLVARPQAPPPASLGNPDRFFDPSRPPSQSVTSRHV